MSFVYNFSLENFGPKYPCFPFTTLVVGLVVTEPDEGTRLLCLM